MELRSLHIVAVPSLRGSSTGIKSSSASPGGHCKYLLVDSDCMCSQYKKYIQSETTFESRIKKSVKKLQSLKSIQG